MEVIPKKPQTAEVTARKRKGSDAQNHANQRKKVAVEIPYSKDETLPICAATLTECNLTHESQQATVSALDMYNEDTESAHNSQALTAPTQNADRDEIDVSSFTQMFKECKLERNIARKEFEQRDVKKSMRTRKRENKASHEKA